MLSEENNTDRLYLMGRRPKREKPPFARNASARAKALGWNGQRLAKEARLPHPTVRDVLAGISPGLEETRAAIAKALGAPLSELYSEATAPQNPPKESFPTREFFRTIIEDPEAATFEQVRRLLAELKAGGEARRAMVLGLAFANFEIAEAYLPEDAQELRALIKVL